MEYDSAFAQILEDFFLCRRIAYENEGYQMKANDLFPSFNLWGVRMGAGGLRGGRCEMWRGAYVYVSVAAACAEAYGQVR